MRGRAGGRCRRAGQGAAAGGARGRLGERQQRAGRAAGWASGSRARRARGARRRRAAGARAGMAWARRGERLSARCARGTAGLGVAWALDGWQTGPAGPVLVHCAPGSVLARFFDPVRLGIFLSHQMNIVHYKIKLFSKKKIIFITFK